MLGIPDDAAFASFSHTPFEALGWASSHAVHSASDAKASTRRSLLVFDNAMRPIITVARLVATTGARRRVPACVLAEDSHTTGERLPSTLMAVPVM